MVVALGRSDRQGGRGELEVVGAAANEAIDVSANAGRARFFRDVGSITMDVDDTPGTWIFTHPAVARVHYPGLPSHPGHAVARAQQQFGTWGSTGGGILTVVVTCVAGFAGSAFWGRNRAP